MLYQARRAQLPLALLTFSGDPDPESDHQQPNFATMKWFLSLLLLASSGTLRAQDSGFGLGFMLGEPTGISGKYWISGDKALDFGVAWGLFHGGYLHVHGDYLFHKMELIKVSKGRLPLYYGPGLRVRSWNDGRYWKHGRYYDYQGSRVDIGVRFPVGLAYLFEGAPVDVFLEVVPTLDLVPATGLEFDAAFGARYWF